MPDPPNHDQSVIVRAAIDTRNAADQLLNFGLAVRSWGVLALVFGMGFAGAALGLRFDNPGDMQAPEFISCLSFSSVVAVVGAVVYLVEHLTRRTVYGTVLTIQPPSTTVTAEVTEKRQESGSAGGSPELEGR